MYIDTFGKLNGKIDSEFVISPSSIITIERVDSGNDTGEKDSAIVTLINGDKIEVDATDYTFEELRDEIEDDAMPIISVLCDLYHSDGFRRLIRLIKDL